MDINFEVLEDRVKEFLTQHIIDHKVSYLHSLRSYVIDAVPDTDKLSVDAIDEIITEALNRMIIDRWLEIGSSQGKFAVKRTDI